MGKIKSKDYFWAQKWRPDNIDSMIFRDSDEQFFKGIIETNKIPNLLLVGSPGLGKTTVALALPKQLEMDYLFLNGRTEGNIDILRTKVTDFISTKSLNGKGKVVIYDEGDASSLAVLDALKTMIEKYSKNATFIITSNHINKFKPAIRSRMHIINFNISKEERKQMIKKLYKRIVMILKQEDVIVENKETLVKFIARHFPDIRHILKALQMTSIKHGGKIPLEISENENYYEIDAFKALMKEFNFDKINQFVESGNSEVLYSFIEENIKELFDPENYFPALRLINLYSFQEAFTSTKTANTKCCLDELKDLMK